MHASCCLNASSTMRFLGCQLSGNKLFGNIVVWETWFYDKQLLEKNISKEVSIFETKLLGKQACKKLGFVVVRLASPPIDHASHKVTVRFPLQPEELRSPKIPLKVG